MNKVFQPRINFLIGDILNVKKGIIAHGVNCQGKMGKGFALSFKQVFKKSFERYFFCCEKTSNKKELLGGVILTNENNLITASIFTQLYYGEDISNFDLDAFKNGFKLVIDYAVKEKVPISMVKIGSGLGLANWDIVFEVVKDVSKNKDVEINVFELKNYALSSTS